MSTRNSITLEGPIHIFEESNSGNICVDIHRWQSIFKDTENCGSIDPKYGVPLITEDELRNIANDIIKYLAYIEKLRLKNNK